MNGGGVFSIGSHGGNEGMAWDAGRGFGPLIGIRNG